VGTEWAAADFELAASIVGLGKSTCHQMIMADQQVFLRVVECRFWQERGSML